MRRTTLVAVLLASLAFSARANEGVDLSLRSKALASAGSTREGSTSVTPATDTMPMLPMMGETEQLGARSNVCANRDVCYDYVSGHVVVRPVREYMPRVNGLTPENVSVRHNRVTFTYSFK
jgi:hypothetical protein